VAKAMPDSGLMLVGRESRPFLGFKAKGGCQEGGGWRPKFWISDENSETLTLRRDEIDQVVGYIDSEEERHPKGAIKSAITMSIRTRANSFRY
jgi:hypothetical protein